MRIHAQTFFSEEEIKAAIVSQSTGKGYGYQIIMMLEEGCKDEPAFLNGWFTDATKASFKAMKTEVESTSGRVQKAKVRDQWLANALTNCGNQPMLVVDNCSVDAWMAFLQTFRTSKGKLLGKTSLGVKCSALYHLFRCHDAMGMPGQFKQELSVKKKGLYRLIANAAQNEGGHDSDGKLPMSYELYVKCCQWLLEKGDDRSIFCHCFLVLTWNLMCRANNTVTILFEHMQWQADHLELLFCQQKNDTTGEKQRFPRRLYANPQQPEVCPIFALALYLGLRDGRSEMNGKLFQGNSQYKHFMDGLSNVLKEHQSELLYMGYVSYTEIGSHSIRKGATKWLSGQPGGPSSISICIRGGWSLGGVKDVYMTYEAEGDAFVGRMLSLLPLLKSEFAVSAPEFTDLSTEELDRHITRVFPGLAEHNQMKPILHRCLAAMAHNKDHVLQWPMGNIIRQSNFFRDQTVVERLKQKARVIYPWEDNAADVRSLSGIPPHVCQTVYIERLVKFAEDFKSGWQQKLKDTMNDLFNDRNVANASISEERIRRIVTDSQEASYADFLQQLYKRGNINLLATNNQRGLRLGQTNNDVSTAHHIHTHKDGSTWYLPEEYEWPQGTAQSLWNAWSTEDTVNKIPPLKFLKGADFGFMAGKVKRTPRRKFNDIKTLCKYIETQAANKGLETANLTIEEADDIFLKIATEENCLKLPDGKRSVRWATTLKKVRESRKLARQPQETNEANPTEPSVNQDEEIEENEEARRNPETTRNSEMTTTPTVVTAETRQIRRKVYRRRNRPAAASREEEKSKRTSHRNGNSRTISTRDCNQKTSRTRSNDRHNNPARKRRRTRNATIYNTPNDDDSEAFAAAFASIEGPTSVDAVNRQRDREEGKDGEEGLNAVMRREAAQVRAARGEPQEEQPVALTDGTALHLNLSANGFPIGPCGIRGGCDQPHQELRPIHRCVHCQTIVHLLCAGEPTDQEQVTCGCRDDYK